MTKLKLPSEILDYIFLYLNDYKMVLPFGQFMSLSTIKYLLKDVSFAEQKRKNNILTLKNMFMFRDYYIKYDTYSTEFIRAFPNRVNWISISKRPLTEEFIDEFSDHLKWFDVALYSKLSETTILKYKSILLDYWIILCKKQTLSDVFYNELIISGLKNTQVHIINIVNKYTEAEKNELLEQYNAVLQCEKKLLKLHKIKIINFIHMRTICTWLKSKPTITFEDIDKNEIYEFINWIKTTNFNTIIKDFDKQLLMNKIALMPLHNYFKLL
jgi:hypothetical protein